MDSHEPEPGVRFGKIALSRRRFLGRSASAVAAGALAPALLGRADAAAKVAGATRPAGAATPAAARPAEALRALGRTTLRLPDSLPFPRLPAGTDTLPGIEHVVVLMLENH